MAAIKSHAFLADTAWDELWTQDAPPLESGPVKGPPPPESPMEFDSDSDDAGEMWDRMADGPEQDVNEYLAKTGYFGAAPPKQVDDEATPRADYGFQSYRFGEVSSVPIPVTDSEPPSSATTRPDSRGASESPSRRLAPDVNGRAVSGSPVLAPTGPHARSSIPPSLPPILSPSLLNADNEIAVEDEDMVPELQPAEQRMRTDPLRASHSSTISGAGTTSSSEGSPLGSAAGTARTGSGERMPIAGGDVEGLRIALAVMGLGGDQERLSSALAPGEKPVFMSSILSRPRHRLTAVMPSKRRILVLTDTPRLLCVKEERDRVVVKSALSFTESGTSPKAHSRGRSIARWKQASEDSTVEPVVETVQSVETKGEKSFVVQTLSKAYTYVAENAEEAGRWVQQIKAVQQIRRRSAQA